MEVQGLSLFFFFFLFGRRGCERERRRCCLCVLLWVGGFCWKRRSALGSRKTKVRAEDLVCFL